MPSASAPASGCPRLLSPTTPARPILATISAVFCAPVSAAAVAFSKKILEEGKPAVDKYIGNFLCGGCSKNPIELLKSAGVDMSTPKPVDDALNVFEEYLKQFEAVTK